MRADTPERWQGLESPVMIALHPLSGVTRPSAFDLETGTLCVMVSRHRVALFVITRDHIEETLDALVPAADQALGRLDVTGQGHAQHLQFWDDLKSRGRMVELGLCGWIGRDSFANSCRSTQTIQMKQIRPMSKRTGFMNGRESFRGSTTMLG